MIGHNLHLSPNPRAIPSEPGEFHDWVAEKDAEIERLRLALRIAVEEIQNAPHAVYCAHTQRPPGGIDCNCWKASALARIERATQGISL